MERMYRRSKWEETSRNQKEKWETRREVQKKNGRRVKYRRNEAGHEKEEWR